MKQFILYICLGIILCISSVIYSNDLEKQKLLAQLRAFRPELQPNEVQLRSMIQELSRMQLAPHEIRELEQLLKQKAPVGFEKYWEKLKQLPGQIDPLRLNHSNSTLPVTKYNHQALTPAEPTVLNPVLEDFQVNENVGGHCFHFAPKIAMDSDGNYVVVWCDYLNVDQDIFAQRYNSSGIKQGSSFQINDDNGSSYQDSPAIAMDSGGNFVVVWEDNRDGFPAIYGQHYSSNGVKQGTNFLVKDDHGNSDLNSPVIAVDNSGSFVVVWIDERNAYYDRNIYGQRYSSNGAKQGTDFLVNDDLGDSDQYSPVIAVDGSGNFMVVWSDSRNGDYNVNIYGQRYSSSGAKQGANFLVNDTSGSSRQSLPAIAVDGSGNFVVVWEDNQKENYDIYGQRYSSNGAKQGTTFSVNDNTGSSYHPNEPVIAVDDSGNFVIVWLDERNGNCNIYGQRYSSSGARLDTNFLVNDDSGSSWQSSPAIAVDGRGNFVVVWEDKRNENYDIYGQRYTGSGARQSTNFLVNDDSGSSLQNDPAISVDCSGNFVVVWTDERNNCSIYGQQYSSTGAKQGINFLVNDDNVNSWQFEPAIAVDGNGNFIVVWTRGREFDIYAHPDYDIYGQCYSSSGAKQCTNFLINDNDENSDQYSSVIAGDGNGNFVVVWENDGIYKICGQRYNINGVEQGTNFLVDADSGSSGQASPAIVVDGSGNFVVVWEDYRNENFYIYGQRFSSSGVKQGTNFLVTEDSVFSWQHSPAIAVDDSGNFVVVWNDLRNENYNIYGQRYSSSGAKQGINFLVTEDSGSSVQFGPAIAMDGNGNFVVVWTDTRNGDQDIYAQLYDNTGQKAGKNYQVNNDNTQKAQYMPDVKFKNGLIYYCWADSRVPGQGWDIFARIDQWPFTNSILPDNDQTTASPVKFRLHQNYPNPFNPETTVRYFLPSEAKVTLTIFDVNGREMIRLFEGHQLAGEYTFTWNGRDHQHLEVPSGVYLCQLRAGALVERRKMVLIK